MQKHPFLLWYWACSALSWGACVCIRLWLLTLTFKNVLMLWIVIHGRVCPPDSFSRKTVESIPLVPLPFSASVQSHLSLLLGACLSFRDVFYAYTCQKYSFFFCVQMTTCHTQGLYHASFTYSRGLAVSLHTEASCVYFFLNICLVFQCMAEP